MPICDLDKDDLKKILEILPHDLGLKVANALEGQMLGEAVSTIKSFISQYDEDHYVDQLVASTAAQVMGKVGRALTVHAKDQLEKGINHVSSRDAARIVITALREEALNVEQSMEEYIQAFGDKEASNEEAITKE